MPPTLVLKKFPSQNDKLITFYYNSETPCSSCCTAVLDMAENKPTYKNLGIPDDILNGIFEPIESKEDEKNKEARTTILNEKTTPNTKQPATHQNTDNKPQNL